MFLVDRKIKYMRGLDHGKTKILENNIGLYHSNRRHLLYCGLDFNSQIWLVTAKAHQKSALCGLV